MFMGLQCDFFFFRYSVEDLSTEQKYLVNLDIQICLEANKPCVVDVSVFKNTKLPKKPCEWTTGFLNEGKVNYMYWKAVSGLKTVYPNIQDLVSTLHLHAYS